MKITIEMDTESVDSSAILAALAVLSPDRGANEAPQKVAETPEANVKGSVDAADSTTDAPREKPKVARKRVSKKRKSEDGESVAVDAVHADKANDLRERVLVTATKYMNSFDHPSELAEAKQQLLKLLENVGVKKLPEIPADKLEGFLRDLEALTNTDEPEEEDLFS